MSSPIISQQNNRAGLCPHGLVPSACPICSSGGMGSIKKMNDSPVSKPNRTNEWSYMKCYAAGLAIKANEARKENAKTAFEKQTEFMLNISKSLNNSIQKFKENIQNLEKILPSGLKPITQFASNFIFNPILNLVSKLPQIMEKFINFEKNILKLINQAGEKLSAILGDIKNFINRKILENLKKRAKKLLFLFSLNEDDENYKNDETLEVFKSREMKKYAKGIIKIRKKEK